MHLLHASYIVTVFVVSSLVNTALTQQSSITIDLIKATLNSSNLLEMKMDDVTNILGRPTFINENKYGSQITGMFGPQVAYHYKGIEFLFEGKKNVSIREQRLREITIYLSKKWDAEAGKFFEQFSGNVTNKISGDWKSDRTINEFKDFTMSIITPDDYEKVEKKYFPSYHKHKRGTSTHYYTVSLKLPDHLVNFEHEAVLHFLERVRLTRPLW